MRPPVRARDASDSWLPRAYLRFLFKIPSIAIVLAAGLVLRLLIAYLVFPGQGLAADLAFFQHSALTLADYGPGGFVANGGFSQPSPVGYLYFLWPVGIAGRLFSEILGQPADQVTAALVKLPAIVADLAIAVLLYRTARRWHSPRAGVVAASLYLFVPPTWYESALFGQVDAVGGLFLLAALLLLLEGWSEPSAALAVLALVIKPQYAIGLAIVGPILLRRHLFAPQSGPRPTTRGRIAALDNALGGWFTRRQGFERLAASAIVSVVVFLVALLPFDLWLLAPAGLVSVPIVGNVSGFIALLTSNAGFYPVLTANAFNIWAVVGPTPLSQQMGGQYFWTNDSLSVLGPIPAAAVGVAMLAIVGLCVVVTLLRRDDRTTILVGFTVLALALFALPTRVHERYAFPVFVTAALLAGTSIGWRWWTVALGLLTVANLHAVLTLPQPGYASLGLIDAPGGDLLRSEASVVVAAIGETTLFAGLLVYWIRATFWPSIRTAFARRPSASSLEQPAPRPGGSPPDHPDTAPPAEPDHVRVAVHADTAPVPSIAQSVTASTETTRLAASARRASLSASVRSAAGAVRFLTNPIRVRLGRPAALDDRTADLAVEGTGKIDRRDLCVALLIVAATFGFRMFRLDTPPTMYFDELYYPSTGAEFLQAWRYGITTDIFEWTHPHVSKYIMAGSLAVLGDDRVTGTANVGSPVRDAAFEPAIADASVAGGYRGDRIAMATGVGVGVAPHGDLGSVMAVSVAGAATVEFDTLADRLYVGTDDGAIVSIDGSALDAWVAGTAGVPTPHLVIRLSGPIRKMWTVARNRLIARTADDVLHVVDGATGTEVGSAALPGLRGLVPIRVANRSLAVAAMPGGLDVLDASTLQSVSLVSLDGPPLGLDFVDGSQLDWENRDTLYVPTLYVALEGNRMEAVQIDETGVLKPFDTRVMPGPVKDVRWDRPTNMVHVLGETSDGRPTIYVIEPHTNAVFADARLPFEPTAWTLDVQPDTPSLDRERAIAFGPGGAAAFVDAGGHAFAWRVPGVLAGALTAGLMYLLARILFRRRSVGLLLAMIMALDGLLFSQGRIAMNDSILGFFVIAALTLLVALMRQRGRGWTARLGAIAGLPAVGLLLGLALGTKWVGAYAIGGAMLLVLAQSRIGRWLVLAGMVALTGIFGYQAVAGAPPNVTFLVIMVGLTVVAGLVVGRGGAESPNADAEALGATRPVWTDPTKSRALPFLWAVVCLVALPIAVYVVSYVPWALSTTGGPQLVPGWPPGHSGQTFLDLQAQMYDYHNNLRRPIGVASPWWAWPFGLKPIGGYFDTFSDGSQALVFLTGNPVLLWLSVPAVAFGGWQAWRRRSLGLSVALIVALSLWLPWARIDRPTLNYHYYTVLPFVYLLLAYFLAELWHGPSPRTWSLAKGAFSVVLMAPALLWIFRDGLCAAGGVANMNSSSFACTRPVSDLALPLATWLLAAVVASWFVIGARHPRRFVIVVLGAAAATFIAFYPVLAAMVLPDGWPLAYASLLPSWDVSFTFSSNTQPTVDVPLLRLGPLAVLVATAGLASLAMRFARQRATREDSFGFRKIR